MSQTLWWKSRTARVSRLTCITVALLSTGGCPKDEEPAEEDAGDAPYAHAACPADLPELRIGLTAEGESGAVQAELMDADNIPAEQFLNQWEVQLQEPDGTPITDASLTVTSFMPAHSHDGRKRTTITELEDGRFDVEDINLWMPGPWEVRLTVESESAGEDYIVFDVCIE